MLGKNYFQTKSVGFRHQTRGLGRMGIDKSLESRMKSVRSLGMKIHLNMRRIKDTKSSVLEYQDLSGYDWEMLTNYWQRCMCWTLQIRFYNLYFNSPSLLN